MKLTRRVKRLEQTLPPPPVVDWQRQKRWHKVYKRWVGLCIEAQPLLGDDQDRVLTAILQAATEFTGPLSTWFIHLHNGLCRLPELSPEAMKGVLLAWLSPEEYGGRVCNRCGLEYPKHKLPETRWQLLPGKQYMVGDPPYFDFPEFFPACPGCGNSLYDVDSPWETENHAHEWKKLDGFVVNPVRTAV